MTLVITKLLVTIFTLIIFISTTGSFFKNKYKNNKFIVSVSILIAVISAFTTVHFVIDKAKMEIIETLYGQQEKPDKELIVDHKIDNKKITDNNEQIEFQEKTESQKNIIIERELTKKSLENENVINQQKKKEQRHYDPKKIQEITDDNWMIHPEIIKIREMYKDIEELIIEESLTKKSNSATCYDGNLILEAKIFNDINGVTRKYFIEGGTGDSAGDSSYYYDETGILRFSFVSARAVNGTHNETRAYFSSKGRRIYTDRRSLEGLGWPGGFRESIKNPQQDFRKLCG